ncbi:hypothetical protein C7212DRAFT_359334 [Tuber magnatum]|uniref:Protein PBN1 n=1 Tax=Tuber magnatum TaxID=42249 RepID=A0A317SHW5_9PEZI|nr:hypothetical protein C7212DRAFT_359334 [Tuber magnatum]
MKHRSTIIVYEFHGTPADNFSRKNDSFMIKISFGTQELPADIQVVLHSHIYESIDRCSPKTPAGLRVILLPEQGASSDPNLPSPPPNYTLAVDSIGKLLEKVFGINNCPHIGPSFIEIPRSYQFYPPSYLTSMFVQYLQNHLAEKDTVRQSGVQSFESAEYMDVTYDAIAQSSVFSSVNAPNDPEPRMISFAFLHYRSESAFSPPTVHPTGLHLKLKVSIHGPVRPLPNDGAECTLNAYFTLPVALSIDKYQLLLENQQPLDSLSIERIGAISGETDLEAPACTQEKWGSRVLIEVDTKPGENRIELDVFWACRSEQWKKIVVNPFDRLHLGSDALFPEQVRHYYLSPAPHSGDGAWTSIDVPVLGLKNAKVIEIGTIGIGLEVL